MVAHKLKNLEGHFQGPHQWPNTYTPVVNWRNIRSLSLRCYPVELQCLNVPYLEYLELEEPYMPTNIPRSWGHRGLRFPRLTTMKLTISDARWLSRVSLPSLTTLDINALYKYSVESTSFIFRSLSLPTVQELTLGPKWNDRAVVTALKSVPNLINLRLMCGLGIDNRRVNALQCLSSGRLCPRLESLFLGNATCAVYGLKTNIVPTIKTFIDARKRTNSPFKEVVVCWGVLSQTAEESFI